MSVAVQITEVGHAFGERMVVDNITLTLVPGSFTTIVGPTGCGKSTVLQIVAGLVSPTRGEVLVDGRSVVGTPGHAAYMPQSDSLFPWMRALDNAALAEFMDGGDRVTARQRAQEYFHRFGLSGFEGSWPRELSGGMRQRVALLRTAMSGSPLLLLDEPFGSLDPTTRADLHTWLTAFVAELSTTTLLVTHDLDEALRLSDTIVVLSTRPGRIVARHDVPPPRARTLQQLTTPNFATLKQRLLGDLGQQ